MRESVEGDTNWSNEEEALWNTFKQRLQEEEEVNKQLSRGTSDIQRSDRMSEFDRDLGDDGDHEQRLNLDEIRDNIERGTGYSKGNHMPYL